MEKILIIAVVLLMFSCGRNQDKTPLNKEAKITVQKVDKAKVKKISKVFNIEKNCTVCHKLPKFSKKDTDYLTKKLDEHRKFRRINLEDNDFNKLKERILKKAGNFKSRK